MESKDLEWGNRDGVTANPGLHFELIPILRGSVLRSLLSGGCLPETRWRGVFTHRPPYPTSRGLLLAHQFLALEVLHPCRMAGKHLCRDSVGRG